MVISNFMGKIITPKSKEYDILRRNKNLYFDYYPLAILYVADVKDVMLALKYATEKKLKVRVRGGGHSAEGFSVADGVIVIDVSRLKFFSLDKSKGIVTLGAGNNLGEIYSKLFYYGYGFPGGNCATVGIVGYVSGAGFSLSARLYGLCCDNLLSIKMVTTDGRFVEANFKENQDLFWAVKGGGGGNFGVIVELKFKVYPVKYITYINIKYEKSAIASLIKKLQSFSALGDSRITLQLTIENNKVEIYGYSYTNEIETKKLISNFILGEAVKCVNIRYVPFIKAVEELAANYKSSSLLSKDSGAFIVKPWDNKPIEMLLEFLNSDINIKNNIKYSISFLTMGGKIKAVPYESSAFNYRNGVLEMYFISLWEERKDSTKNICFIENMRELLKPYTCGVYVNDIDIYIKNYMEEYYGANAYKLSLIRKKYNKSDILDFPQIIK